MKKILSLLLCVSMLTSAITVFADEEPSAAPTEDAVTEEVSETEIPESTETPMETVVETPSAAPTEKPGSHSTKVSLNITVQQVPNIQKADVVFELYDTDGRLLDAKSQVIDEGVSRLDYTFNVPDYTIGKRFRLRCAAGLSKIKYYSDFFYVGQDIEFDTYEYKDANGNTVISDGIAIDGTPNFTKSVAIGYDGYGVDLYPAAKLVDGVTMVPIRQLAEAIGLDAEYNSDYNVEIISLGDKKIYFNVDTAYTTVFGKDLYAPHPTFISNGTVYVALRTFADAIESSLAVTDYGEALGIQMSKSNVVENYFKSEPVNAWGISSRTQYMVWVSKSQYKVRVYKGRQYRWKKIYEASCAIGAPGTPTITGSYEYQYKTQWNYNGYYVGPCLVFHGGYALHSVLLRYDNTEYDGRTGVQISHGCIRLKKKDIDWIANTIPLKTRIYVTN